MPTAEPVFVARRTVVASGPLDEFDAPIQRAALFEAVVGDRNVRAKATC